MTILLEDAAISRGLADLADAADVLDSARLAATRRVEDLMARWQGDAAESFAAAYDSWASAAAEVRVRLEALRDGVAGTRTVLDAADGSIASGVGRIAERLG